MINVSRARYLKFVGQLKDAERITSAGGTSDGNPSIEWKNSVGAVVARRVERIERGRIRTVVYEIDPSIPTERPTTSEIKYRPTFCGYLAIYGNHRVQILKYGRSKWLYVIGQGRSETFPTRKEAAEAALQVLEVV